MTLWSYYEGLETALTWLPDPNGEFADAFRYSLSYPPPVSYPANSRPAPSSSSQRHISYLAANFIRAFGSQGWHDKWAQIAIAEMRRLRFNTFANYSDW